MLSWKWGTTFDARLWRHLTEGRLVAMTSGIHNTEVNHCWTPYTWSIQHKKKKKNISCTQTQLQKIKLWLNWSTISLLCNTVMSIYGEHYRSRVPWPIEKWERNDKTEAKWPQQEVTVWPQQEVTAWPPQEIAARPQQEVTAWPLQKITACLS